MLKILELIQSVIRNYEEDEPQETLKRSRKKITISNYAKKVKEVNDTSRFNAIRE